MNLRNKLLLGYLVSVVALVVLGGWSVWHLRALGQVSGRILSNNYDSVVAAQDMKESLERQDSTALFLLLGGRERPDATRGTPPTLRRRLHQGREQHHGAGRNRSDRDHQTRA